MPDSDSSLSSPPSSEDEMAVTATVETAVKPKPQKKKKKNSNILSFFKQKERSPSPPRKKRAPSPPHDYVLADNQDIAFIVMFRSRFSDAFPRGAPHVGPQDIELGAVEQTPSPDVEGLLCALLGLVLNRKKPVEKGHYGRALEEAIQTQKHQWPIKWQSTNPLSGGRNFNTMSAEERVTLLHTLTLWSLNQNEQIKAMVNNAYKSRTTKDKLDTNIPLSVQPWGRDGDRNRFWLIEGQNDTHFRVYREKNPALKNKAWWSVAGSIDELQVLAKTLDEDDGHREARTLGERMINAIPRFESSEMKRKRREYRVSRNATFTRPEPGFSLYEGRTRGKRLRYTFSDEEDFDSDPNARRSARTSGRETPAVPSGPTVTASGRQVRSRATGLYGETLHSGQVSDRASPATGDYIRSDASEERQQAPHSRATRAANRGATNGRAHRGALDSDEEDDATSWDGGDEDEDEPMLDNDNDADDVSSIDEEPRSLVVTLRYSKASANSPTAAPSTSSALNAPANAVHAQSTVRLTAPAPAAKLNMLQGAPPHHDPPPAPHPAPAVLALNGIPPTAYPTPVLAPNSPSASAVHVPHISPPASELLTNGAVTNASSPAGISGANAALQASTKLETQQQPLAHAHLVQPLESVPPAPVQVPRGVASSAAGWE